MKDRLIALLKERSVRFGTFTLKSGKTSDLYVDARTTTFHAEGSVLIANLILERLKPEVVAVGGPATGAIPMAGAVAALSFIRGRPVAGFMVRKEPKGHGTKQCGCGPPQSGGQRGPIGGQTRFILAKNVAP